MGFTETITSIFTDIANAAATVKENNFSNEEKQILVNARDILKGHNKITAANEIDKIIAIAEGRRSTPSSSTTAVTGYELAKDIERSLINSGEFRAESSGRIRHVRTSVRIFKLDRTEAPELIKLHLNRSGISDDTEVVVYLRNGRVEEAEYIANVVRYEKNEYEKAVTAIMDAIRR